MGVADPWLRPTDGSLPSAPTDASASAQRSGWLLDHFSVVALPLAPAFGVVLAAGALSRTHDRHDESVAGSADSASLTILRSALPGTNGLALLVGTLLSVIALPKEALPKEPLPRLGPMATGPPQLS